MFKVLVLATVLVAVKAVAPYGHEEGHHDQDYYVEPNYSFAYEVKDPKTGDYKSHKEERKGEHTQGVYSLHEPDGSQRTVEYAVEGKSGFNVKVQHGGQTHKYSSEYKSEGGYQSGGHQSSGLQDGYKSSGLGGYKSEGYKAGEASSSSSYQSLGNGGGYKIESGSELEGGYKSAGLESGYKSVGALSGSLGGYKGGEASSSSSFQSFSSGGGYKAEGGSEAGGLGGYKSNGLELGGGYKSGGLELAGGYKSGAGLEISHGYKSNAGLEHGYKQLGIESGYKSTGLGESLGGYKGGEATSSSSFQSFGNAGSYKSAGVQELGAGYKSEGYKSGSSLELGSGFRSEGLQLEGGYKSEIGLGSSLGGYKGGEGISTSSFQIHNNGGEHKYSLSSELSGGYKSEAALASGAELQLGGYKAENSLQSNGGYKGGEAISSSSFQLYNSGGEQKYAGHSDHRGELLGGYKSEGELLGGGYNAEGLQLGGGYKSEGLQSGGGYKSEGSQLGGGYSAQSLHFGGGYKAEGLQLEQGYKLGGNLELENGYKSEGGYQQHAINLGVGKYGAGLEAGGYKLGEQQAYGAELQSGGYKGGELKYGERLQYKSQGSALGNSQSHGGYQVHQSPEQSGYESLANAGPHESSGLALGGYKSQSAGLGKLYHLTGGLKNQGSGQGLAKGGYQVAYHQGPKEGASLSSYATNDAYKHQEPSNQAHGDARSYSSFSTYSSLGHEAQPSGYQRKY